MKAAIQTEARTSPVSERTWALGRTGLLQRKCACGGTPGSVGECEACRKKRESKTLQRVVTPRSSRIERSSNVSSVVHEVLRSHGQPLDAGVRAFMEPRLGYDFSRVRVHDDTQAAHSARNINAHAYTVGRDVVFGSGRYAPSTTEGRRLIAHELAHVVQQSTGPVSGKPGPGGLHVSQPDDRFERDADDVAARLMGGSHVLNLAVPRPNRPTPITPVIQREAATTAAPEDMGAPQLMSWSKGPSFGEPIELPVEEAAERVNEALDRIGPGLTYVRRPPSPGETAVAQIGGESDSGLTQPELENSPSVSKLTLQTFPSIVVQRKSADSSLLARIHGGVVGSMQVCWDCLTGEASLKGWLWAGVGYDAPFIGWVGGYYFGEKTWWLGQLGKWFDPGVCATNCDRNKKADTVTGIGIAGFPIDIKPKQRAILSKAGLEVGVLVTPHSFCDGDLELIALLNLLNYLGPVGGLATKAVDGLNAVTRNSPQFKLEAGIDLSAAFHLCRSPKGDWTVTRADFCGGGYVGAGLGLSHTKNENHGAS